MRANPYPARPAASLTLLPAQPTVESISQRAGVEKVATIAKAKYLWSDINMKRFMCIHMTFKCYL